MLMTPWWWILAGLAGVYLLIAGTFGSPRGRNVGGAKNARITGLLLLIAAAIGGIGNPWIGGFILWGAVVVGVLAILKDKRHS